LLPFFFALSAHNEIIKQEDIKMAALSGKAGKVMYGSVVVANITQWSASGFKMEVVSVDTPFGTTGAKTYIATQIGDAGTVSFEGNYDPADTTGQAALATMAKTGLGCTNLYLYETAAAFWRVGAGGSIFVTNGGEPTTMPRNGIGKVKFDAQVSGAYLERAGS
jgi:hypothetical protein